MKRTPLMRRVGLRAKRGIRWQSPRQTVRQAKFKALVLFLIAHRAHGRCEICGGMWNLWGHHIVLRSQGGKDTPENTIIACGNCHDHHKYTNGIPLSMVEAVILVAQLNQKYDIKWGDDDR